MRLTDVILAFAEKWLLSIFLLVILVNCKSKMFPESLIILGGILSGAVPSFIYVFNNFM